MKLDLVIKTSRFPNGAILKANLLFKHVFNSSVTNVLFAGWVQTTEPDPCIGPAPFMGSHGPDRMYVGPLLWSQTDKLLVLPPSVRVQVGRQPSWKICLRIQLSISFWGRAVKAYGNFSQKLAVGMTIQNNIWKFYSMDLSPWFSKEKISRQNCDVNKWQVWIWEAFLGRIWAPSGAMDGWHWHIVGKTYAKLTILCHHAKKLIYHFTN